MYVRCAVRTGIGPADLNMRVVVYEIRVGCNVLLHHQVEVWIFNRHWMKYS